MKTILHIKLLLMITGISISASAQTDRLAYAVTDSGQQFANWNFLRTVDTKTGLYSDVLASFLTPADLNDIFPGNTVACSGVAAIAYDKKNKRLYYTPMLIDRLSYIDLKTMKTHVVTNNFTGMKIKAADQSNIFTRMVIAADNNGYALTNDGHHLIRFTTDKNAVITNLGSLVDAPGNGEMSIHNGCSSFGGDIISDDAGNLYLITSRNTAFKINIHTKVATYLGPIGGLPVNFATSSVAVVHSDNKLIIVSAVNAADIYLVDPGTLKAEALHGPEPKHTADIANASILRTKKIDEPVEETVINVIRESNNVVRLYPNPVTSNEFTIQFTNPVPGNYKIDVLDVKGQAVVSTADAVGGKRNTITIKLPGLIAKGMFIVRVLDNNNKIIFSEKIIVQ